MSERILTAIAGLLALVVLGVAFFWHPEMPERPIPRAAIAVGGDFTLQSAAGPVSLKDYRGKLVLVYFGYTYCPDICPTSLAATAEGLKQLTPEEQARVAMIFISVDPKRDTPERLKEYAEFFHPAIVGVTGTAETIADVARRYGVF
jgi:protein SCO1/2